MSAQGIPELLAASSILPASHDSEAMAIATYLARYKGHTLINKRNDLKDYMAFCRYHQVGMLEVERGHLELFIREMERHQPPYAQATIARKFGTVFNFLDFAEIDDRIAKNPARKVARPKVDTAAQKRTWFEIGEIHAIIGRCRFNIDTAKDRLAAVDELPPTWVKTRARRKAYAERALLREWQHYAMLTLLSTTGMRVGEVCQLDVNSLHIDRGLAYIDYTRKGNKYTQTKLPTGALTVLMKYLDRCERDGSDPMFVTVTGQRITRAHVQAIITRTAKQVGITRHVSPHGLRRTFATTAHRLGATNSDLQGALNHADPRTTGLYIQGDKGGMISRNLVDELVSS